MVNARAARKAVIRTPDQRLRVFVSSTLLELADERKAAKRAIGQLRLNPVMFEMGARPHPPRELYKAYIEQSHIFIGIYWERYGWVAPGMDISGLEDEFIMSEGKPRLIYIKKPAKQIEEKLQNLFVKMQTSGFSYKSFSDTEELAAMIEDDLAQLLTERFEMSDDEHAAVQSISRDRIELPAPPTALIGREREVGELKEILSDKTTRLITLSGTGGIGKSRLALEVAWQMQEYFPDGIYFIPLAHLSDPALVPSAIIQSIVPSEVSMRPPEEIIKEGLLNKSSLLLIDNFEQVIESADFISRILILCPYIKIMVTSRELLRIKGEKEYNVPPLSLPHLSDMLSTADQLRFSISQSPAVQLFIERAHAIKPGFSLTSENAQAIADICTQLDGIPLAIELAAARSKILSPQEMLPHLNRSLNLLTDGARDMPERHRKLYATIDWSYHLLKEDEKQLLHYLSVFAGGCNLRSAWAITYSINEPPEVPWSRIALYLNDPSVEQSFDFPAPDYSFVDCMESLVNKNMLYTQEDEAGQTRFYFYNVISEYSQNKLQESGESLFIRKNHLMYFLRMAEKSSYILRSMEAPEHYRELDREMENMRAALNFGMQNFPTLALRIAIGLGEYWDTRNMPREAKWWLENLLTKVENSNESYPPTITLQAKIELCRIEFRLGNYSKAISISEELIRTGRQTGNKYILVDGILYYCLVASYGVGLSEDIKSLTEEGLKLARELNYTLAEVDLLQHIAASATMAGEGEKAIELAAKSLELARGIGATRWEAIAYGWHAFASLSLGRIDDAKMAFSKGLELCSRLNDNMLITYCFVGYAQIAFIESNAEKGVRLIGAVERLTERSGTLLVPSINYMFSQIEETVRSQVGAEIFNKLKAEGKDLSLEQACKLAVG